MSTNATNTNAVLVQDDVQVQAQAAAQAAANVQEAESENGNTSDATVITGTIIKVMLPEGTDERISFVLDKEFDTIDFKTGEIKTTNILGLNIYAVVNQVDQLVS